MNEESKKSMWSSFWLNDEDLPFDGDLIFKKDDESESSSIDTKILKLSSGRRAIANFVSILTGQDIPVFFCGSQSGATDGKVIYLTSNIVNKEDFDPAVGLALHEASHIIFTDFELIKIIWGRISELYKIGRGIGLNEEKVRNFTRMMVNYIEDRFIDDYVFKSAPGYRPYYISLYEKYFNNELIGKSLSSELMRQPTLPAYEARIINLTNLNTDLNALPGLRKIAETISLKNISRLTTTKDRIKVAIEVTKIVFSEIKKFIEEEKNAGKDKSPDSQSKKEFVFDIRMDDDEPSENDKKQESSKNENNKNEEDEDDIIGGVKVEVDDSNSKDKDGDDLNEDFGNNNNNATKRQLQKIKKVIDNQKKFLEDHNGDSKKSVTDKQKQLLDTIEKSGIVIIPVGVDLTPANIQPFGIECVVVKKLTRELMFSGLFPLCSGKRGNQLPSPNKVTEDAVIKGIQIGKVLGKKLQIRQETNVTKFIRRKSGKLDRRTLSDIGFGAESVFYKMEYDAYDKLNLHISVDSSGSMADSNKWGKTISMVVAICKAASMVSNLRVSVSFRCTIEQHSQNLLNRSLPYVVMAYDSAKDKFSKIRNLFPYLTATGATPEGLAFEATMNELICKKVDETYYFLTISDGEPCFQYNGPNGISIEYNMSVGAEHTRKQYNKILQSGVKGIAYFIKSSYNSYYNIDNDKDAHTKCFKRMYGKDAKFINVNSITDIAKTMNGLFLDKD